jgi:hypothetical protein
MSSRQDYNKGITTGKKLSQANFHLFVNIFGSDAVNAILHCVPLFYYFILYANKEKLDSLYSIFKSALIANLKKNEMNNLINSLTYSNNNYEDMNKSNLLELLITTIQQPRSLSNTFIDDIFRPEYILNWRYDSSNYRHIFTTSFYYLLKCKFNSVDIPLLKSHHFSECTFPLDIDPLEWLRPCVIIDVSNQFYDLKSLINPKTGLVFPFLRSDHNTRREYILQNIDSILDALFKKEYFDHPNMLVLFIHPSDHNSGSTCTEILDMMTELQNKELLEGNKELPLNRKALYISIPCNLFLPPDLDTPEEILVRKPFHTNIDGSVIPLFGDGNSTITWNHAGKMFQGKPGFPLDLDSAEIMDAVKYDKYGKVWKANVIGGSNGLYTFPSNDRHLGYRTYWYNRRPLRLQGAILPKYNNYSKTNTRNPVLPFDIFKPKTPAPLKASRPPSRANLIQATNLPMQRFVETNSDCSRHTNLHKNELDDYMIALIMHLRQKTISELSIPIPYLFKCVLFTNDYYDWINDSIFRTGKPGNVIRPCLYRSVLEPSPNPASKITFLNFLFDKENYQLNSPIVEVNPRYHEFWTSLNIPEKIVCEGLTPRIYDHFYRLITRFNLDPLLGITGVVAAAGGGGGRRNAVDQGIILSEKRVPKPRKIRDLGYVSSQQQHQQQQMGSYQLLNVPTMIPSPRQED